MSNTDSGERVATAIGAVKWVLIGIALLSGAVGVINTALQDNGTAAALTVSLAIVAGTAVSVLFVWVLFGWFEHTLMALVTIARNTAAQPVMHPRQTP